MTGIIITTSVIGVMGLLVGIFLGISSKKLEVPMDEKELKIREALPGNNCGACGYPGCDGLAAAILNGDAGISECPVGGEATAREIAGIMGVATTDIVRLTAYVRCRGTGDKTASTYIYSGVELCGMLELMPSKGPKMCKSGCEGYGSCVKVCPFDAISIEYGVAVVDKEKCKSCKKCIGACPRGLIELVPYDSVQHVGCNSCSNAKEVMKCCKAGCIGCRKCVKVCPVEAIIVKDFLAYIDYSKCISCGECAKSCPRKIISPYGMIE